jgi:uncharacterized protein YecE (DUF72 family)
MIRVGIGGWVYAPWRGTFYPKGLPQARELAHASRQVTTIEINGTFYGSQRPASFRHWAEQTPDDFVFSLKAPRFATHRRVLAEAAPTIERFFATGVLELKSKLGPVLWQFPPSKSFDADDFAAFLALLPQRIEGRVIRHAVEVQHRSFGTPAFVDLMRKFSVAVAVVESDRHALIPDVTGDFVYLRLQRTSEEVSTGYSSRALAIWANRLRDYAAGRMPDDLAAVTAPVKSRVARDVFAYVIAGAKARAPAAAMALIERLN